MKDYSYTLDFIDAEIDSLKDAYKKSKDGLKHEYSTMILEWLHVKKLINEQNK